MGLFFLLADPLCHSQTEPRESHGAALACCLLRDPGRHTETLLLLLLDGASSELVCWVSCAVFLPAYKNELGDGDKDMEQLWPEEL